ncbi:unnamed protein product [Prorocentrum cordatum]|uniref:Helitron helicase-like domain-containing protein n=1 Tax=Prorocentrum cordatum TaxID=2364126 RepID=A0ABN9VWU2_9DINO|nr:unnamed protein product [Polarella glacialis]
MARPSLWRFGDAANLYPDRRITLTPNEWMRCLFVREDMEYDLPGEEPGAFRVCDRKSQAEINRFAGDWVTLRLFSSIRVLAAQQESTLGKAGGDIHALAQHENAPQIIRDALNIMQMASARVLGADGHRRLCRHEGNAYTALFGPPLGFCTPNLADGKQPCLLVIQNRKFHLDGTKDVDGIYPRCREMLLRLAKDPVGQTRVFHLMMLLFFQHVLGVRPECIESRRGSKRSNPRDWCTDGAAASACAPGIFGPVLAFREEIEAQGRDSLHPRILVWLVLLSVAEVVVILRRGTEGNFQRNLYNWMKATVAAAESISQSSVRSIKRRFGDLQATGVSPLGFSATGQSLSCYDGESELGELQKVPEDDRAPAQTKALNEYDTQMWCRPCLPLRRPGGESVCGKPISDFAVGKCPLHRRRAALRSSEREPPESQSGRSATAVPSAEAVAAGEAGAGEWEASFTKDVRSLATDIFVHICGDSCRKYSGPKKVQQICRRGFYYIAVLGDWGQRKEGIAFRRRGKALRNQISIVKATKHGMQGRLLMLQEHPFEVQTNYAGAACIRCNLDVQRLRRVLPESLWKSEEEPCPHLPPGDKDTFGHMGTCEWDGEEYAWRTSVGDDCRDGGQWADGNSRADWRRAFLRAFARQGGGVFSCGHFGGEHHDAPGCPDGHACECLQCECTRAITAAFADAINTGFYVNSYTAKQCPTMDGALENLRKGIERLGKKRDEDQEELEKKRARGEPLIGEAAAERAHPGDSEQTMQTSGQEMIFPMLYGRMTFASHRCWTVYVKKGIPKSRTEREVESFDQLCFVEGAAEDGNQAFTCSWLAHSEKQSVCATEAARRFLDRNEYMSLWETQEIVDKFNDMWESDETRNGNVPAPAAPADVVDPDADKPRATVPQHSALIARGVQADLEGLARARVEKHERPYQTDAGIHQSYILAATGGSGRPEGEPDDDGPQAPPEAVGTEVRPPLRCFFDEEEMQRILDFEHRPRLTPFLKGMLELPLMDTVTEVGESHSRVRQSRAGAAVWRRSYQDLLSASFEAKCQLKLAQEEALDINAEEGHGAVLLAEEYGMVLPEEE